MPDIGETPTPAVSPDALVSTEIDEETLERYRAFGGTAATAAFDAKELSDPVVGNFIIFGGVPVL